MGRLYIDGIADIILERVNILDVVNSFLPLKRTGRNYKALCPFHNEKTPSFVVSDEKQIFHCFGCGESGSAISFVMKMENLDFIDSIEYIAEKYSIDLDPYKVRSYDKKSKQIQDTVLELNKLVAKAYYYELNKQKSAYDYLLGRKLTPYSIRKFGLGFAPDEWDFVYKNLRKKYDESILLKSGFIIQRETKTGYYDRFRNRIMFPIFDIRGRVIGFGGRIMDDTQPKYMNSPDTPVFNKSFHLYGMNYAKNYLGDNKQIVIVEGYMDVISLYDKGIKNVAASLGTALTEGHGKLIKRYAKEVVLLYDSDEAGIKATRRAIEVLSPLNLHVKVLTLPDGYDPDEYILKYSKNNLVELINNAKDAIEYLLDYYKKNINFLIKSDVVEYINLVKSTFYSITNDVEYELYIEKVSKETNLSVEVLKKQLQKKNINSEKRVLTTKFRATTDEMILIQRLIEIFVNERKYFEMVKEEFGLEEVKHQLFNNLCEYIDKHNEVKLEEVIDKLSLEEIQMLEGNSSSNKYIPVKGDNREVKKLYYDIFFNNQKRLLQKIKEERDLFLSNIEEGSIQYLAAEKRYKDQYTKITSKLAEINKKRG